MLKSTFQKLQLPQSPNILASSQLFRCTFSFTISPGSSAIKHSFFNPFSTRYRTTLMAKETLGNHSFLVFAYILHQDEYCGQNIGIMTTKYGIALLCQDQLCVHNKVELIWLGISFNSSQFTQLFSQASSIKLMNNLCFESEGNSLI